MTKADQLINDELGTRSEMATAGRGRYPDSVKISGDSITLDVYFADKRGGRESEFEDHFELQVTSIGGGSEAVFKNSAQDGSLVDVKRVIQKALRLAVDNADKEIVKVLAKIGYKK